MSNPQEFTIRFREKGPRRQAQSSEHSTTTSDEEEDSADTGVNIEAVRDLAGYSDPDESIVSDDGEWTDISKPVGPSESASRLSPTHDQRHPLDTRRRSSQREADHYLHHHHHHQPPRRNAHLTRARRQPHRSPPDSDVGSHEDLSLAPGWDGPGYPMPPPSRPRPSSYHYAPHQGPPGHQYGPGYGHHQTGGYGQQYPPQQPPQQAPSQQLMRVQSGFNGGQYSYGNPAQSPYYGQSHHGSHHNMQMPVAPHPSSGYGTPDMMHHHPQYMQHGMQHGMQSNIPHGMQPGMQPSMQANMQPGMQHPGYFPNFAPPQLQQYMQPPVVQVIPIPTATSPPPAQAPSATSTTPAPEQSSKTPPASAPAPAPAPVAAPAAPSPAPPPEPQKDERFEELKSLFLAEKAAREEKEKEEQARIAKAIEDKKRADEIAAAAKKAAEAAKSEAEKKAAEEKEEAAKLAAEHAAKIKAEAEEAMKKAAEEAAASLAKANEEAAAKEAKAKEEHEAALAAAAAPPPAEKAKPIRFKDAVGRKFNFPFHLCQTWEGMEDLIKQAFLHVDVIGQHVQEGHYDLIGPNNEIILPAVWSTVIEPDWAITMHMWPLPEPEPEPEAAKAEDPMLAALDALAAADLSKDGKKDEKKGKGKAGVKAKTKNSANPTPPLPAGVEIVGGPQPLPPPAPPGSVTEGTTGQASKKKPPKGGGWSIFGGPKPKPKPKNAVVKKAA